MCIRMLIISQIMETHNSNIADAGAAPWVPLPEKMYM